MIAIFAYDLYYKLIPDAWAYIFAALALLARVAYLVFSGFPLSLYSQPNSVELLLLLSSGPAVAAPLFAPCRRGRHPRSQLGLI